MPSWRSGCEAHGVPAHCSGVSGLHRSRFIAKPSWIPFLIGPQYEPNRHLAIPGSNPNPSLDHPRHRRPTAPPDRRHLRTPPNPSQTGQPLDSLLPLNQHSSHTARHSAIGLSFANRRILKSRTTALPGGTMSGELYQPSEAKSLVLDVIALAKNLGLKRAWLIAHRACLRCGTGGESRASPRVLMVAALPVQFGMGQHAFAARQTQLTYLPCLFALAHNDLK
ncbi:hypothetical protein EV649_0078 [Kribbella sp. VKM Ac-2569]|nr:hypothetical protein EV649_0078 [Kribbella sp. VKM Ac-2569]